MRRAFSEGNQGPYMTVIYEIYADEAWTHSSLPLNRYWCFFGGIFGQQCDLDRLDTSIRKIRQKYNLKSEIKWKSISAQNINCYKELVSCLFSYIESNQIKYRQFFTDLSYIWVPNDDDDEDVHELTTQFRFYYIFLKRAFGIEYLPVNSLTKTTILIHLDNHSSQQHKDNLIEFSENLPRTLRRPDIDIKVAFKNSKKDNRLQICDLIMGAAGSYGNKQHEKREPGIRGMKPKQKLRLELSKHIYNGLKNIVMEDRNARAFNWFESTGFNNDPSNKLNHKVRIWKFKPQNYQKDKGWENDHLDEQGNYIGPDISDEIFKAGY